MAEALKILNQIIPTPGILTDAYVVPAATQTVVSSIIICNQANVNILFRISFAVNSAADDPKQYIYKDVDLDPNDTFTATLGISLGANDCIRCYSNTAGVSFSFFGAEVS